MLTRERAGAILDRLAEMQAEYYARLDERGAESEEDALQTRAEGIEFLRVATDVIESHQHEWQPAGVVEINPAESVVIMGMCKCGELTMKQWDT